MSSIFYEFRARHAESAARRAAHVDVTWDLIRLEAVEPNAVRMTFANPRTTRAGKKTYRGAATLTPLVTHAEIDAELRTYEATTGHCGDCFGKGKVPCGHSVAEGTRYQPCDRCSGTGRTKP